MTRRQLAEARGTFEHVSGPGMLPIGKTVACQLHKDMASLGVRRHYQVTGEIFGRTVLSLAALTRNEAAEVWRYSCAFTERPTLPSIVYRQASA